MMEELEEIFGSHRVPQVRGLAQFAITACTEDGGGYLCSRVLSTRQISLMGPPCPDLIQEGMGQGDLATMVHLSPVEVARTVRTWRTTPAREAAARRRRREERAEAATKVITRPEEPPEGVSEEGAS